MPSIQVLLSPKPGFTSAILGHISLGKGNKLVKIGVGNS